MRKKPGTMPQVAPLPFITTETADALIEDAYDFMYAEGEKQGRGVGVEWAENWLADLERAVMQVCALHAGDVGVRTPRVAFMGEPAFRHTFRTRGGSPWQVYYIVMEQGGKASSVSVEGVLHGRAKGKP